MFRKDPDMEFCRVKGACSEGFTSFAFGFFHVEAGYQLQCSSRPKRPRPVSGFMPASTKLKNELEESTSFRAEPNAHRSFPSLWSLYEPEFVCDRFIRVGEMGDGGKWLCLDPAVLQQDRPCVVYSFGSSGQIMFEVQVAQILRSSGMACQVGCLQFAPACWKEELVAADSHIRSNRLCSTSNLFVL